jgi:hypothetical protein
MKRSTSIVVLGLFLASFAFLADGCKSKEDKKHNRTLKGTIEEIDIPGNTVSMNWFNEKLGKSMVIAGIITKETEIYIDGKLGNIGNLSQAKTGDKVIVEGYKKGTDVVAVKINITQVGQATKINRPTTQPAK